MQTGKYTIIRVFSIIISLLLSLSVTAGIYAVFFKRSGYAFLFSVLTFICLTALSYWFFTGRIRRRKKILKQPFPASWRKVLHEKVYFYSALDEAGRKQFEQKVQLFLGETLITGIKTVVDDTCRVLTAASAVIPVFGITDWDYDMISEILIYPANFNDEYDITADEGDIQGMAHSRGSVLILSKPALYRGFEQIDDKMHVGIHEFVHKIDEADGRVDGVPLLLIDQTTRCEWDSVVEDETAKIKSNRSDINPYALTNRAEFFSVTSEYFFERPGDMAARHPALYALLRKIYRQDPRGMFTSVMKNMFLSRRKGTGRNAPCPCGSGKKYKKCCMGK